MIKKLRENLIGKPLLKIAKKIMPPLSPTEKTAGKAGTPWWEADILSGNPDWQKLYAIPAPKLSEEEEKFLAGPVETLCGMIDSWKINQEKDLPPEVWDYMKKEKFFGMIIPKKYGGLGFSALGHSTVVQKIATKNLVAAVTVMVPNSLGPSELLLQYGTEEQKNYYLPRLAAGKEIPCFALTEPEAGSDASSIKSNGVVCRGEFNEKEILGIRLNWEKRYITLGPVATLLGLAFQLRDPERLLGKKEDIGITLALIPTNTMNVEIGKRHNAMDSYFQVGPNYGKDVFIPLDWIIGGKEQVGQGWKMLMNCLGVGRSISLPALSSGSAKLAAAAAGAYARVRRQFKLPIAEFEGIKEVLAKIGENAYIVDAVRLLTASAVDAGGKPSVASAIAKYHATELAREAVIKAMDVFGGSGICQGPKNILGDVYKSQPVGITVEGANILTRSMMIPAQLIMRCHPYVKKEMEALEESDLKKFDEAIAGHIAFTFKNLVRSITRGLTGGRTVKIPTRGGKSIPGILTFSLPGLPAKVNPELKRYHQELSRFSSNIALTADLSVMIFGGKLKKMESLGGRIGDVASKIYLASAVLKRFKDDGEREQDLSFVHLACQNLLYEIQETFYELFRNYPIRLVGKMLKKISFPYGRTFEKPSDKLRFKAADKVSGETEDRENLIKDLYLPSGKEPLGRLEIARNIAIIAGRVEKALKEMKKRGEYDGNNPEIIAAIEIIAFNDALRKEIVQVDAFEKL